MKAVSPMQAFVDAVEIGGSVTSSSVEQLERVYEAVLACVGVATFVTLMFLLLASGGMLLLSTADVPHQPLPIVTLQQFLDIVCASGL